MSTAGLSPGRPIVRVPTKVSRYDRVSAMLTAAIVLVGFLTTLFFLIFLTHFTFRRVPPPTLIEMPYGDQRPEGYEDDIYEPGVEDFPEIEQPALSEMLESLTEVASSVPAYEEVMTGDDPQVGRGAGGGSIDGGIGGGDANVLPEWLRWQVEYASTDLNLYASQLAHFGIEIGLVHRASNDIDLVGNLGSSPAARRTTRREEERVYFLYTQSRLQAWDETLARRAGLDTANRILVQFYPDATRATLLALELQYLQQHGQGRTMENVQRTVFRVRSAGAGFEYFVHAMDFR